MYICFKRTHGGHFPPSAVTVGTMPTALLVAEKPSIARELAAILDPGHGRERSLSQYNPVFSLACDIQGTRHQLFVTSVAGHLMERDFGPAFKSWSVGGRFFLCIDHGFTCMLCPAGWQEGQCAVDAV